MVLYQSNPQGVYMDRFNNERFRLQVFCFLRDFKENLLQNRAYFYKHQKNLETLIELGLTCRDQDEILLSLQLEDYSSGPEPDMYHSGQVFWVFGKQIEGVELYLKLKIVSQAGEEYAVCISFHAAEYPLEYPFRK